MKGEELIVAAIHNEDTGKILKDALLEHLLTGKSMDCLLGLKSGGDGAHSPRRRVLQQLRGKSLFHAWRHIKLKHDVSDKQACVLLMDMLNDSESIDPDLKEVVEDINLYSTILGIKISSAKALLVAINNLLTTING